MNIWGTIAVLAVCIVVISALVSLGLWAKRNPAPASSEADEELEWMNDIK